MKNNGILIEEYKGFRIKVFKHIKVEKEKGIKWTFNTTHAIVSSKGNIVHDKRYSWAYPEDTLEEVKEQIDRGDIHE